MCLRLSLSLPLYVYFSLILPQFFNIPIYLPINIPLFNFHSFCYIVRQFVKLYCILISYISVELCYHLTTYLPSCNDIWLAVDRFVHHLTSYLSRCTFIWPAVCRVVLSFDQLSAKLFHHLTSCLSSCAIIWPAVCQVVPSFDQLSVELCYHLTSCLSSCSAIIWPAVCQVVPSFDQLSILWEYNFLNDSIKCM